MRLNKHRNSFIGKNIVTYIFLLFLALICILPFYNMIIGSTHDNATLATSFKLLPGKYFFGNYSRLVNSVDIWRGIINSIVIAVAYTLISTYIGALTAYGFAKFRFKGNKILFWVVLVTMMLPGQLGIIGYFQLMSDMNLLDNYLSIIIPSFANPMMVYWNRQYIDSYVPNELIESARCDGCSEYKIFNKIIFPIIIPGVATQAIFTFVGCWNSFVQPSILLFSQEKFTLPVMIQQMQGIYTTDYGIVYLGVTMSVIPILIIFIFCSKKIMEGSMAGAVKG